MSLQVNAFAANVPRIPGGASVYREDRAQGQKRTLGPWDQHLRAAETALKAGDFGEAAAQVLDLRTISNADHRVISRKRQQTHMALGNLAKDIRSGRTSVDQLHAAVDSALSARGGGTRVASADAMDAARRNNLRNTQIAQKLQIGSRGAQGFNLRRTV